MGLFTGHYSLYILVAYVKSLYLIESKSLIIQNIETRIKI